MKEKEQSKKGCELIFILDRSGSMGGLEEETINGYNSVVKNQSKTNKDLKVTTVLFDNIVEKIYDGVNASEAMLDGEKYFVRGTTAMLDAVGTTIKEVETRHKKLADSEKPKVIVAITTDGYENASKEYTFDKVKKLVEAKRQSGWEFIFMAANIDEKLVGANLGINVSCCERFESNVEGIKAMTKKMSMMVNDFMQD